MLQIVRILKVGTPQEYTKQNGEKGCRTDMIVEWTVDNPGQESYKQSCAATYRGFLNMDNVNAAIRDGLNIRATMYMEHREWQGRFFTNISIFLPSEYKKQ